MIDNILGFLIAIALGALIGLEREYSQIRERFRKYGGIRTFPLIALLGAIAAYGSGLYSYLVILLSFAGLIMLISISHYYDIKLKETGVTTEIAGMITFWVGVLAYTGNTLIAVILAITTTLILYEKTALHAFAARIKNEELYSTIKFAIIAFVVLPILPDKAIGPWGFFNPYEVWKIVVFVSGISFVGYVIGKFIRSRGDEIAGFIGGFVSSTATTFTLLQSKKSKVRGIIAANAAMMVKVLIIIFLVNIGFFMQAALPILFMITASGIIVFFAETKSHTNVDIGSPFRLQPALTFAVIFSIVLFAIKIASIYLSSSGIYGIAFITGLFDADSVALSALTSNLANAGIIAVIAVIANTVSKGILAAAINRKVAWKLAPLLGIVAAVGLISLILMG